MASANEIPEGRFQCYATASNLRFFEKKIIVPLKIDAGGTMIETSEFMTVDPSLKTSGGKVRAEFTIEALEVLGATNPADEIADARDDSKPSVQISGLETPRWVECVVTHSNGYANVAIYKPRPPADAASAKKDAAGLRSLGKRGSKGPDPFAPPPGRGTPIAPPARQPPPANEPAKPAAGGDDIPF